MLLIAILDAGIAIKSILVRGCCDQPSRDSIEIDSSNLCRDLATSSSGFRASDDAGRSIRLCDVRHGMMSAWCLAPATRLLRLYVADHTEGLKLVLEHGGTGETYNIGARCEWTNLDVVERVCDLLDEISPASWPIGPGHDLRYAMAPARSNASSAGAPRESFESGLAKTVRWFCDNRTWWQNILDRGYQRVHRPRLAKNSVVIRSATH
ncbi:hypothetical protein RAD16_24405 [Bradyrhizobium sp. 18BD]